MKYSLILLAVINFLRCQVKVAEIKSSKFTLDSEKIELKKGMISNTNLPIIFDAVELLLLEKLKEDFESKIDSIYLNLSIYRKSATKQAFQDSVFTFFRDFQAGGGVFYWNTVVDKEQRRHSIISEVEYKDLSFQRDTFFALKGSFVGGLRHNFIYFFNIENGRMNRFYVDFKKPDYCIKDFAFNTLDTVIYNKKRRYPDIYITDIEFRQYRLKYHKNYLFKPIFLGINK